MRNAARVGKARVPQVALFVTAKRLERPTPEEGFDALHSLGSVVVGEGREGEQRDPEQEPDQGR